MTNKKIGQICSIVIAGLLLSAYCEATEWQPATPNSMSNKYNVSYKRFWLCLKRGDFVKASEIGVSIRAAIDDNHQYLIDHALELISEYSAVSGKADLSRLIELEKYRISWQRFGWWPNTARFVQASQKISSLVKQYQQLLLATKNTVLEKEVLYGLALCLADSGSIGFKSYTKAIELLSVICAGYSESEIAGSAYIEKLLLEINFSKELNISLTFQEIIERLQYFLEKYPKSSRINEARYLLGYYHYLEGNYSIAIKEYADLIDIMAKTLKRLEILDELSFIYREKTKDNLKEKTVLEIIVRDYPESNNAMYAKARLMEIELNRKQ